MKRIFIIENNEATESLNNELNNFEHEIISCTFNDDPLNKINAAAPDILIINSENNDLGSVQLWLEIRSSTNQLLKNLQIIIICSQDSKLPDKKLFNENLTVFFIKPFDFDIFKTELDNLINQEEKQMGGSVLIVDDSTAMRSLICNSLEGLVGKMTEASSGKEAVDILMNQNSSFDLIITDYEMPVMSGPEFCNKIRNELNLKTIPVIFVTSISDKERVLGMFESGATDYIHKPFMREELKARIEVHLEASKLQKELEGKVQNLKDMNNKLKGLMDEMNQMNQNLIETKNHLWSEMEIAEKIQTSLLPLEPGIEGFEITAYMDCADEVGGDYYDVINKELNDWIIIGDVSGHGVPAGLIMMMVQTSIHVVLDDNPDVMPSELLYIINKTIYKNIKKIGENKYMTITAFHVLDNIITFAGLHQDIFIYRKKSNEIETIETDGMWIGVLDDIESELKNKNFEVESGDVILLYTDGITEAKDSNGKLFSEEKLKSIFQNNAESSVEEIKKIILNELESYQCNDDITCVIIRKI